MRRLSEANLNLSAASAGELVGVPIAVLGATLASTRYGPAVRFTVQRLNTDPDSKEWQLPEGDPLFVFLSATDGRRDVLKYFEREGAEPLGPCTFDSVSTPNGDAYILVEWAPLDAPDR